MPAPDYLPLWNKCQITRLPDVDSVITHLMKNQAHYVAAQAIVPVPWFVLGVLHYMEADFDFGTVLANGDRLGEPTEHVPAGLLARTWEEGVRISIEHEARVGNVYDGTNLSTVLWYLERYNGLGYRLRGLVSPYLWSFSNLYVRGKYLVDGRFSATAISGQCGAAVLLLRMVQKGYLQLVDGKLLPAPNPDATVQQQTPGASA